MISNAGRENRRELLRLLHRGMENLKAKREVDSIAREVHKSMHLQEPNAHDIGRYLRAVKSGAEEGITSKIRTAAAQTYVDSILEVRTKPLPGRFKREDEDVAATIENIMVQKPFVERTAAKEFYSGNRTVAKSVSRLLALHYEEEGGEKGLTLRLKSILPYLSAHLQAETLMAVENKFASPGRNLPKHSVLEIYNTLERLQKHKEEIVRANAKNVIYTALNKGNLSLADKLAEGAQEKYGELTKHKEEIVRINAKTIIYAALHEGNLSFADKLAEGAQEKYGELTKHKEEIVRANAKTIINAALRNGNLSLADKIAEGAQEKYEELTKHKDEIVRINARNIISAALNRGNLSLADKFADKILKRPDNAREILRNYFSFNGE